MHARGLHAPPVAVGQGRGGRQVDVGQAEGDDLGAGGRLGDQPLAGRLPVDDQVGLAVAIVVGRDRHVDPGGTERDELGAEGRPQDQPLAGGEAQGLGGREVVHAGRRRAAGGGAVAGRHPAGHAAGPDDGDRGRPRVVQGLVARRAEGDRAPPESSSLIARTAVAGRGAADGRVAGVEVDRDPSPVVAQRQDAVRVGADPVALDDRALDAVEAQLGPGVAVARDQVAKDLGPGRAADVEPATLTRMPEAEPAPVPSSAIRGRLA